MCEQVTRKTACVIGDPIAHSLSPLLHQSWIKALGLRAHYTGQLVSPEAFNQSVQKLFSAPGFVGMNITLPHKAAALAFADEASDDAKMAGAANVLVRKNNKTFAENTDIEGFMAPLLTARGSAQWRGTKIVIIGAGGAARAVILGALKLKPSTINLLNRTDARATSLAAHFGAPIKACAWVDRHEAIKEASLIVNTSAAGMTGKPALDLSLQNVPLGALVYDLVYTPLETPLLLAAKQKGLETLGGLDMLIGQARPSFHSFFGKEPPKSLDIKSILIRALDENT